MAGLLHQWRFASEAELVAGAGAALLLLAGLAMVAERGRNRRSNSGAVGWMPWTGVFLVLAMAGTALIAVALPVVLQGR